MKTQKTLTELANTTSVCDDYDPNSMPVEQAREYIKAFLSPVQETERVHLYATLGRVLAEEIHATDNVPNHDNSAMDGYAFNADDLGQGKARLKITGAAFAGNALTGRFEKGACVRIMTGAAIPAGADTVIAQERVELDGEFILLSDTPNRGANVRYAGEDLRAGQVVLNIGHQISPADLGLIASLGIGEVSVYRKLKVSFFSTGDELASIGSTLKAGQIFDSNRYTLFGMLTRIGVEIQDLGAIPDDPILLEKTLIKAAESSDVILTSGGVSVGEADYMKQLLQKLGQVLFWKIAMKPGRPLAFGKIGNVHYFGLPGNPVAVMVTFYQFVRQAMLVLMGQANPAAIAMLNVGCTSPIKKLRGRTEFQRGILFVGEDGQWQVKTTGNQSSGVLSSMSQANCFIVLDDDVGNIEVGTLVKVQLFDGVI
ncbi:MAG: molybdopterin molybdotransferase MoeA [Sulfuritalea sp.]|jgi:molybdopterin molybdotransferase|nr:molybdopterin molybdotransferase MoeA [Sulfuritalea sp.]